MISHHGEQTITVTRKLLEVLGGQTRIEILIHLSRRQRTVTSLSRMMNKSKATLHEHLRKLEEAGLVERCEARSKWVYYQLSSEGRKVVGGRPLMAEFHLGLLIATLALALSVLDTALRSYRGPPGAPPLAPPAYWIWLWFLSFLALSVYFLALLLEGVRDSRTSSGHALHNGELSGLLVAYHEIP